MSRRNWIALAAIGLALALSSVGEGEEHPQEPPTEPTASQEQPADQAAEEPGAVRAEVLPTDPPSREHDERAAADGDEQTQQSQHAPLSIGFLGDGWAQWAMALFSLIALLISAWAVWLLQETLTATRAAVREAESATKAAQDAVEVTRETGQAQVRAYLEFEIDSIDVSEVTNSDLPQTRIEFAGKIRNTGQSPAHAYRVLFDIEAEKSYEVRAVHSSGKDFTQRTGSLLSIGSGKYVEQSLARTFSFSEQEIWSKKRTVRLMYVIRYTDVFDEDVPGFVCGGSLQQHPKTGRWAFFPSQIEGIERDGDK
jgi:hypothetical protein